MRLTEDIRPLACMGEPSGILGCLPRLLEAGQLLLVVRAVSGRQDEVGGDAGAVAGNAFVAVATSDGLSGGLCNEP
jgi:hypothetical protein